jgi:uncharacterized membrane-anchored protein
MTESAAALGARLHEHYHGLYAELHARPFPVIACPTALVHIAVLREGWSNAEQDAHLAELYSAFNATAPINGGPHQLAEFGDLNVRIERHQEFTNYTFSAPAKGEPFVGGILARLPPAWLAGIRGRIIALIRLRAEDTVAPVPPNRLADLLRGTPVGSRVIDDAAQVWTSFRLDDDNFSRFLIQNRSLTPERRGRLVQRLLEIETYRMMVLLELPLARANVPRIRQLEDRLTSVIENLGNISGLDQERAHLTTLTALAADIEHLRARSAPRFNASEAYYKILTDRLRELRETEVPGYQTLGEFLDRRMTPAQRTCESMAKRLGELSLRISSATELMRTRIEVNLESQNQRILESVDRRAALQLRLQAAVEGLSFIAISYYIMGLCKNGFASLEHLGLQFNADIANAIAFPVTLVLVWFGLQRLKRRRFDRKS